MSGKKDNNALKKVWEYRGKKKVGTVVKSKINSRRCYKIIKAKLPMICPDNLRKKPYKKRTKKPKEYVLYY